MTELRDRLLAPCAIVDENKVRGVDAGALILRLLFFEGNILDRLDLERSRIWSGFLESIR